PANSIAFGFGIGAANISLDDNGNPADGFSRIDSPDTEQTDFRLPSAQLSIAGTPGDDVITVGTLDLGALSEPPEVIVDTGAGADTVDLSASNVPVLIRGENVTVIPGSSEVRYEIEGTAGNDDIHITQDGNTLLFEVNNVVRSVDSVRLDEITVFGLGGNDRIETGEVTRAMTLRGGAGNDTLIGGAGSDRLFGQRGDDVLAGRGGDDFLNGGPGFDRVSGEAPEPVASSEAPNPVAYWRFNETSGAVAADDAGERRDGTYFGNIDKDDSGPNIDVARFGAQTSAEFSRNNARYVAVSHDEAFEVSEGTVMLFFNTDRTGGNQTLFAKDRSGRGDGGHLNIGLDGSRVRVRLESADASFQIRTDAGLVKPDRWHHLAFTFGSQMQLYLDGQPIESTAFAGGLQMNREPIVIGGSNRTNTDDSGDLSRLRINQPFDGHIDEVSFFAEALSGRQIRDAIADSAPAVDIRLDEAGYSGEPADYTMTFVNRDFVLGDTRPVTPDPAVYWAFNETIGRIAADSAGAPQNAAYFGRLDKDDPGPPPDATRFGSVNAVEFFRGNGGYVAASHDPVFEVVDGTFQGWFNTDRSSGRQALISKDHSGFGAGGHLNIEIVGSRIAAHHQSVDMSYTIRSDAGVVSRNTWHHFAYTFGGEGMRLYLDGELVAEGANVATLLGNREPVTIGGSLRSNNNDTGNLNQLSVRDRFDGHIDEVSFFQSAFTAGEVQRIFEQGTQAFIDAADPDGRDRLRAMELVTFGDGSKAVVLGTDSEVPDTLDAAQVQDFAADNTLLVLGEAGQALRLLGEWLPDGVADLGPTAFNRFVSGPTSVLTQDGIAVDSEPPLSSMVVLDTDAAPGVDATARPPPSPPASLTLRASDDGAWLVADERDSAATPTESTPEVHSVLADWAALPDTANTGNAANKRWIDWSGGRRSGWLSR
ncbi:MAG: LamG-like jellyroll fold domain-containing protein, partial [Gammaproteobacteria bacterium]